MKTITQRGALLGILLLFFFCSAPTQAETPSATSGSDPGRVEIDRAEYERFKAWQSDQARLKKNVETVKEVLAAEGREDTEAFFAPFSEDSTFWMIGSSPSAGKLEGLPAQKAAFNMFMDQLESATKGVSEEMTEWLAANRLQEYAAHMALIAGSYAYHAGNSDCS